MRRVLVALVLGLSLAALASPSFPAAIRGHLGLSYDPPCTLCHSTASGGLGTATTPVGLVMHVTYGVQAENTTQLLAALDVMADAGVDTDKDGVSDIAELEAGTDPNYAPGAGAGPLKYGCGAEVVPSLAVGLSVLLLAARSRRR